MNSSRICFYVDSQPGLTFYCHPKLTTPVQTCRSHSQSVVISLAEFLSCHFRGLLPPKYDSEHHLLVSTWSEVICQAIIKGNAVRIDATLYVKVRVEPAYQQQLLACGFAQKSQLDEGWPWHVKDYTKTAQYMNRKQKHVLLLLASHSTKVFDRPRLDLQALYLGTFFDNENWHVYRILEKHHPPEEVIDSADVIIMPGSNLSVNDHNPYIEQLKITILEGLARKSTTKFLGICFGAQFLTYMFGGSVKRAKSCTQKLQTLHLEKHRIEQHPFLSPLWNLQRLKITEYHGDQISFVPQNFNRVASSESCVTEVIASKCNRYFGMQCHPDYNSEYLNRYIENYGLHMGEIIGERYEEQDDGDVLRDCIRKFLH